MSFKLFIRWFMRPLLMLVCFPLVICAQRAPTNANQKRAASITTVTARNEVDSFSYALGLNIAINLREQGVTQISEKLFLKAFHDVFGDKKALFNKDVANKVVSRHFAEMLEKQTQKEILAGMQFLAENKKRPGVKTTPSGLQYSVLKEGQGTRATDSSIVEINYTGTLLNGTVFGVSPANAGPAIVKLDSLTTGISEALKLMPAGSKWKVFVPFYLAYGDKGAAPHIPPGATLIFELELVGIKEK